MGAKLAVLPDIDEQATFGRAEGSQLAHAQAAIAENALRFVEDGLLNEARQRIVRFDTLTASVQAHFYRRAAQGFDLKHKPEMAKTRQAAMRQFHEAFKEHSDYLFGVIPAPWIGGCDDKAESASAQSVLGCPPAEEPREKAPLQQAYQMAKFNRTRAEQRIAVLYLLGAVVRGHSSALRGSAQDEFEAVAAHLWKMRQSQTVRLLAMGTLLGGDALEENKQLVKQMYGPGMSVIELLERDSLIPGSWESVREERLRKAIGKA